VALLQLQLLVPVLLLLAAWGSTLLLVLVKGCTTSTGTGLPVPVLPSRHWYSGTSSSTGTVDSLEPPEAQ
jgi:hypothetical protein